MENEQTRCTRCHSVGGNGGSAGPILDGIGNRHARSYLLESLVMPDKAIAEGFATTVVELHSGDLIAGVISKDQDGVLEIMTAEGESKKIAWDRISSRRQSKASAMPSMAGTLTKRQIRDLIAYLASLRKNQ